MRAPTAFSPLLSYRGDEVASARTPDGRAPSAYNPYDYVVVVFARASREYSTVRLAAQVVGLLIP